MIEAFDEETPAATQLALFPAERSCPNTPRVMAYRCGWRRWSYIDRDNGARAGWPVISTSNLDSISSGPHACPIVARAPVGSIFCRRLVLYRLIDPGSEWRLHRLWFEHSAMGDLLGADYSLVEKNALYRCLDKVLEHKRALFDHLTERWQDLFGAKFDVLLYDLTSTYFESDRTGGSKRTSGAMATAATSGSDCVQVVIALVVTPEGFPLAYEVLPGNTSDKTTLKEFLQKIETQYGKSRAHLGDGSRHSHRGSSQGNARRADPPVYYLVGTPKGRLTKLEQELLSLPWQAVRPGVKVKLLPQRARTLRAGRES